MADNQEALEWHPIQGFPAYEVSWRGDVRRIGFCTCVKRVLRRKICSPSVLMYDAARKQRERSLAEVVAVAFHGHRPTGAHRPGFRDGNHKNVSADNVFWDIDDRKVAPVGLAWRLIPGFPDFEISENGIVRRLVDNAAGRKKAGDVVVSFVDRRNNHVSVSLTNGSRRRVCCPIGNLLARAFYGPPPAPSSEAAHNDGDPRHNHFKNIRWATRKENSDDRIRHGTRRIGIKNPRAVFIDDTVREIRRQLRGRPYHGQIAEIARDYGVSEYAVHCLKHNKTWKGVE